MRVSSGLILAMVGLFSLPGYGSSEEAWGEHRQEVKEACAKASELHKPKLAGEIIDFDDSVAFDAVLLRGSRNKIPSIELCLFDKSKRVAHVADANSLLVKG